MTQDAFVTTALTAAYSFYYLLRIDYLYYICPSCEIMEKRLQIQDYFYLV